MAQTYTTSQGDVVDYIAWKQYGRCDASVLNNVLAANPGLADLGAVLPAGVQITLPDIVLPANTTNAVSLWD
jgi:phage tail protein X